MSSSLSLQTMGTSYATNIRSKILGFDSTKLIYNYQPLRSPALSHRHENGVARRDEAAFASHCMIEGVSSTLSRLQAWLLRGTIRPSVLCSGRATRAYYLWCNILRYITGCAEPTWDRLDWLALTGRTESRGDLV